MAHYCYWRNHGTTDYVEFNEKGQVEKVEMFSGLTRGELSEYCSKVISKLPDELPSWEKLLRKLAEQEGQ